MPRLRQAISKFSRLNLREQELETKSFGGTLRRFSSATDGFEMVEYAVMTALIVGGIVMAVVLMMVAVTDTFANAALVV